MKKKLQKIPHPKQTATMTGQIAPSVGFSMPKKISETSKTNTMKKLLLFLLLLSHSSCQTTTNPTVTAPSKTEQTLVVQVLDLSQSASLNYFDTAAARTLYNALANSGGGTIKLINVTENSLRQNVYTIDIPSLNVTPIDNVTNVYQLAKIKSKNQKAISEYRKQAQVSIGEYANEISKPHDAPFTDLESALSLATTGLFQKNYDGYAKYLLICSDMINDPPNKKHAPLTPIQLPNTTVLVVRPALSLDSLKVLFPQSEVLVFTSVHDAISILNNHKN